jgi:8-oxo-dGTP pyrophosphatase MutT (NUDIX family)
MAGQEGAPAPEDPERRTGRRRRRRRSPRAKARGERTQARAKHGSEDAAKPSREAASAGNAKRDATGRKGADGKSSTASTRTRKDSQKTSRKTNRKTGRKTGRKKTSTRTGADQRGTARKLPTQREVSAGGVVYRRADDGIEVVLASRRTRRGDLAWGLAKGGIEPGESREDAALREVREETGLDAAIEADLGDTRYIYVWEDVRIRKRVHFFLMRHTGGDVDDRDDEMEEVRWFPLERARTRAAYRGERDVLARAAELLR